MHKFFKRWHTLQGKKFPLWIILFTLQLSSATPCLSAHYRDWKWVCQERYNLKNENMNTKGILITQQIHFFFLLNWEINLFPLTFFQNGTFFKAFVEKKIRIIFTWMFWKLFCRAIHGLPHKHKRSHQNNLLKRRSMFSGLNLPQPWSTGQIFVQKDF